MTPTPPPGLSVVIHRDKELLAHAAAARLVTALADAQAAGGAASVVLTGGRNGNGLLAALAASPARDAVDWGRLDVWWGDERFLPHGHQDRNDTQARAALLDAVPLDPERVHPMPASDGRFGDDPEAAAAGYAEELAAAAGPFDVLLLGVGPDTHVASLFPGHAATGVRDRTVVAVREAPKPPPTRLSLTLPVINSAREVWLLAACEDKAEAVGTALGPEGRASGAPAAAVAAERTLWLLDEAAAARLPGA
ncbi:6-phosphogluconolactonase [Streptomyces marincola]|uniref:6-phosphogluconolactonase n=1 Tax=Streptomyces marincola TaxID=2878388 RepID=A0A1W7D2W8_9ACTN|nr:6-phosphogluconolactonase [Streptomyces marincola]ARQ71362.1 6-phosphogluconolactonase [Streptomyces marincola]